jgi:TonB family protein
VFLHLDETRPEADQIERAITLREAVVASVAFHTLLFWLMLWLPTLPWVQRLLAMPAPQPIPMVQQQPRPESQQPFMMVEPRMDREALRRLTRPAPTSDLDREARSRARNPKATNSQPLLLGRSPELTESAPKAEKPKGEGPRPEPSPTPAPAAEAATAAKNTAQPTSQLPPLAPSPNATVPRPQTQASTQPAPRGGQPPGGALGEALRNLSHYAQDSQLNNPNGGNEVDPAIQFDSKGVEFGPWLRRFIAQVKRNWFVPYAAMSLRGHVVIQFNVHKDGSITDLQVIRPSDVGAFNNAAQNALAQSNPTMALPPEYPTDKAFFTVTFYYNENPPR